MTWLTLWLLFGVACALIAGNKGESGCLWLILGVLFGPFALVVVLLTSGKQCPRCQSRIHREAARCPRCREEVAPPLESFYRARPKSAHNLPPIRERDKGDR